MASENENLTDRLRKRIRERGPITYEEFLDVVLYDEQRGYYRRGKRKGRDYYTSPEIHAVFGKTIAKYLDRLAELLGVDRFSVLELGGGEGDLARAILSSVEADRLAHYVILEKGKRKSEERIEWRETLDLRLTPDELTFVIANEFFDALPFHRVMSKAGALHEICIGLADGFFETLGPLTADVSSFLNAAPLRLNDGQVCEVTPRSSALIEGVTKAVRKSFFLVFDYGYHGNELTWGRFADGSAVGYSNMVMRTDFFAAMGEMDITHHVNFDQLSAVFQKQGWKGAGEIEQYRFLYNIGILEELARLDEKERARAKMLITPQGLGSALTALAFTKGIDVEIPGFKKSRLAP